MRINTLKERKSRLTQEMIRIDEELGETAEVFARLERIRQTITMEIPGMDPRDKENLEEPSGERESGSNEKG